MAVMAAAASRMRRASRRRYIVGSVAGVRLVGIGSGLERLLVLQRKK